MVDEMDESLDGPEERRSYDRKRLIVDVFFDGKDATGVASTKDISVGGFYMNTKTDFPVGANLMVRIPFGNARQIVANAEVVYCDPGRGIGVRFPSLSEEVRELIESELKSD